MITASFSLWPYLHKMLQPCLLSSLCNMKVNMTYGCYDENIVGKRVNKGIYWPYDSSYNMLHVIANSFTYAYSTLHIQLFTNFDFKY